MEEYIIEDQEELDHLVEEWKEALKLQAWTITAEIVRYWDFGITGRVGHISWTVANRTAHMKLLDGNDHPPDTVTPNDMEVAVVHELLHLVYHFVEFEPDSMEGILFEQAIEATAQALVAAKRARVHTGGFITGPADPNCRSVSGTITGFKIDNIDSLVDIKFKGHEKPVSEVARDAVAQARAYGLDKATVYGDQKAVEDEPADQPYYCRLCDYELRASHALEICRTCREGSNNTHKEG